MNMLYIITFTIISFAILANFLAWRSRIPQDPRPRPGLELPLLDRR